MGGDGVLQEFMREGGRQRASRSGERVGCWLCTEEQRGAEGGPQDPALCELAGGSWRGESCGSCSGRACAVKRLLGIVEDGGIRLLLEGSVCLAED